ncbi:MAG: alpha/beta hydrolase, partial [Solirubrobacterales bacterium]
MSRYVPTRWRAPAVALVSLSALFGAPSALAQFDQEVEGRNYSKTTEREVYITKTPEFQARLAQQEAQDNIDLAEIAAAEAPQGQGARNFTGNICFQRKRECAGDVRFYDWEANGFGMSKPLLFGGRSGATLSARVWATPEGPAKRPAIVITTGSVQAPETLYWGIAAALAKNGYVVLTYDVQGQGRSDTFGEGADQQEGFPSQAGQPFFDGTEDALDFVLSKPSAPYVPRPSCSSGTSHKAKHDNRVAAGLNTAFNPFHDLVDPERIGIAGHSLGAGAVSFVGQKDPRVDAIVAWDNLSAPGNGSACPFASDTRGP